MYPRKLTTCEERNERFAGGIRVVGRGYTPHSLEEFHTSSAERIGGRLLSCYRDNFLSANSDRLYHIRTVKLITSGGGVKFPPGAGEPGPALKMSVVALSQPKPTVVEKGFPGPDLDV